MNKFLTKLINLLEIVIGAGLLLAGVTGYIFSIFLFNALLCVMGFFILADGLSKVDDPGNRDNPPQDQNNEHRHGPHGRGPNFNNEES